MSQSRTSEARPSGMYLWPFRWGEKCSGRGSEVLASERSGGRNRGGLRKGICAE